MEDSNMSMEYGNGCLASVALIQGHVPVQPMLKHSVIPKYLCCPSFLHNLMLTIACSTVFQQSTSCYRQVWKPLLFTCVFWCASTKLQ